MIVTITPIEKIYNLNSAANISAIPAPQRIVLPKAKMPIMVSKVPNPIVAPANEIIPLPLGATEFPWLEIVLGAIVVGGVIYIGYQVYEAYKEEERREAA